MGIKFFKLNKALYKDNTAIVASSNTESAKYVLDTNQYTQWESIGSTDGTPETLTITLSGTLTLDRIHLTDMNFKTFTIKYKSGGVFVDFANVVGVNGATSATISESSYALDSAYYEFDAVSTTEIQVVCTHTQVVNEEKLITMFVATEELGEFTGYPRISNLRHDRSIRRKKTLSGKSIVQKQGVIFRCKISLSNYNIQNDIDLCETLFQLDTSFLIWLCGGKTGSDYFRYTQLGYGLKDIYNVDLYATLQADYVKGVYVNGVKKSLSIVEVI